MKPACRTGEFSALAGVRITIGRGEDGSDAHRGDFDCGIDAITNSGQTDVHNNEFRFLRYSLRNRFFRRYGDPHDVETGFQKMMLYF